MANFLNVRGSVRVALAALSLTGLIASSAANAIGEIELTKSLVLTPTAGDASGDNPVTYQAGDVLNYTITATNTGSVDATNLNIGDSLTNVTGCSLPATVTPGQSITCNASYVIQQSDIDGAGFVHNEATATYVTEGDQAQFTTASVDAVVGTVANQDLPLQCGIDIVLVMDSSGSIANFGAIDDMTLAARSFATAFSNTGTRMAITSYNWDEDNNTELALPFTDLTPATVNAGGTVDLAIGDGICGNGVDTGYTTAVCAGGATNWEAGLVGGLRELQSARQDRPRLVVHLTDGSPNMYLDDDDHTLPDPNTDPTAQNIACSASAACPPEVARGRGRAVTDSIAVSNQIKATGAHVYAIGVGGALSVTGNQDSTGTTTAAQAQQLLIDSSGTDVFSYDSSDPANSDLLSDFKPNAGNIDVILVNNFADLAPILRELASSLCSPSITITKLNVSADPSVGEQPAEGVRFEVDPGAADSEYEWVTPMPADVPADLILSTDANGIVQAQWSIEPPTGWENANGLVSVDEVDFDPNTTDLDVVCTRTDQDGSEIIDLSGSLNPTTGEFDVNIGTNDIVTCEIRNIEKASPAISLDKGVTDANGGVAEPGDTLNYSFVITNTGNVPLNPVTLSDPLPNLGALSCTRADASAFTNGVDGMAIGEVVNCSASYTVTDADVGNGSVDNTATVSGTPPGGNPDGSDDVTDTDNETVPTGGTPAIETIKEYRMLDNDADNSGNVTAGDTISFTITLNNIGNVTLTNLVIDDPVVGYNGGCGVTSLPPGGSCAAIVTYVVTAADAAAGQIYNVATGTGDGPGGEEVTDDDDETVPVIGDPSLAVVKTMTGNNDEDQDGNVSLNDTLNYQIVVTNDGQIPLTGVTVTDSLIASLSCNPATPASLAVGDSVTCTGAYQVTQADVEAGVILNTATGDSDQTDPEEDSHEEPVPQNPKFRIVKDEKEDKRKDNDSNGVVSAGDELKYQITLTNNGNVTLTGATISDSLIPASDLICKTLVDGVTHAANAGVTLAPGEKFRCIGWYTVTQADADAGVVLNVATGDVDGLDPKEDDEEVPVAQNPELDIVKTMTGADDNDGDGANSAGDTLNYQIVTTNTGDITLTNVTVTDSIIANLSCAPATPATLAPGDAVTCTGAYVIAQADVDAGQVVNVATADSDQTDPKDDDHVETIPQNPGLGIDKELTSNADEDNSRGVTLGDTLTYTITATNTGDVTLTNVTVTDSLIATLSCTPANGSSLAVGDSMVCTGDYVVQQADVDAEKIVNTAVADSDQTDPEDDTVTTPVPHNPNLGIVKKMTKHVDKDLDGLVTRNDRLRYQITVTNTGDMTLTNVTISDPLFDSVDPVTGATISALVCKTLTDGVAHAHNAGVTLLPGEKFRCNATYKVTADDVANGHVLNVATGDSDQTDPEDDSVDIPTAGNPAMTITKDLTDNNDEDNSRNVSVGDTIFYTIVVKNTGDTNLTNVSVSDPMLGNTLTCTPAQPSTLAPNDKMECVGSYVVVDQDAANGQIVNTATADSDQTDPVDDTETTVITTLANLAVTKEVVKIIDLDGTGDTTVGDKIKYRITIKNVGTADLTNVTFTDSLVPDQSQFTCNKPVAGTTPPVPVTLTAGEAMKCVTTYKIVASDLGLDSRGYFIENVAIADSDETDPEDDSTVTWVTANSGLSVDKQMRNHNDKDGDGIVSVGDKLTYRIDTVNTGDTQLTGVTVSDSLIAQADLNCFILPDVAANGVDATNSFTLEVGETLRCKATLTVEQADVELGEIVNVATADSDQTDPETDTETVDVPQNPTIGIDKELAGYDDLDDTGDVSPGDVLNYTITVTNTGPVLVSNVTVTDALIPSLSCNPAQGATLLSGETMVCTGSYTVTVADQNNQSVSNTAVADSDETDPVDDTVDTAVSRVIDLTLKKVMSNHNDKNDSGTIDEGDKLTYRITATNNGNVILNNVTIVDNLIAAADLVCTHSDGTNPAADAGVTLLPGEKLLCVGKLTVTRADQEAGIIRNTATADSDETDPEEDIVEVFPAAPSAITATRTIGYWGNHPLAVDACFAAIGSIDLGFITLNSASDFLSMLNVKVAKCPDNSNRSQIDKARAKASRQIVASLCNVGLLGSTPAGNGVSVDLANAASILAGNNKNAVNALGADADAYNNSGSSDSSSALDGMGPASPATYPDVMPNCP